ncbi:MAG TPA: hypothetical protein VM840_04055 [Actinomycetota bacterium]|nr:hypothetical protein [Actinomycetota bacterium]
MRRYITALLTLAAVLALWAMPVPASAETHYVYDGARGNAQTTGSLVSYAGSPQAAIWVDRPLAAGVYTLRVEYAVHAVGANSLIGVTFGNHSSSRPAGALGAGTVNVPNVKVAETTRRVEVSLTPGPTLGYSAVQLLGITVAKTG